MLRFKPSARSPPYVSRHRQPDKRAVGSELKNGEQIPGADLKFGELRLVLSAAGRPRIQAAR
jgi:hypothetical protein